MIQVKGVDLGAGRPKICAPLIGETREELLREAVLAKESGTDLVEWRIDYYEDVFQADAVMQTLTLLHEMLEELPLLFTFRTLAEGGKQEISIRGYHALYQSVVHSGLVDMVDIELSKIESFEKERLAQISQLNIPIIISTHNFKETPADPVLLYQLNLMEHFGAAIGKIAVTPQNERDVLRLMELTRRAGAFVSMPLITLSMGKLGMISRLSGNLTGSVMTFGALTPEKSTASGQMTVKELKEIIELLNRNDKS
ncbi:type I 3-dehydroquinate dehydratase [Enterococcus ratti]|uniref:3-dehydroquinate dehydratase n=1 Tax=Enterococcus ratti TaxID=150033 RepID=A0A1L8WAR4_9ENTE|nr:type I 3-dehydroquinate dehydratase [Enterococcus ratti]OJG78130.1 3-dehydroquinate dehydratase, type I [Enterococcus ratti]